MSETPRPFSLDETYVFLQDGGAAPRVPSEGFWQELMSGRVESPGVRTVAAGDGWLLALYRLEQDAQAWERHPIGDELLTLLSGGMDVVFEVNGEEMTVSLNPGETCLVPKGTWHRQVVREKGRYIGITYGKGTEHRPR